jgi:hypothetical protein
MAATFKEVRRLQGERVRMYFDDGREVVAQLLCATKDIDGSKHLIYDKVESGAQAEIVGDGAGGCSYEHADAEKNSSGPRGRDRFSMRDQAAAELKAWRASA